ncbi:hypothetical protein JT517_001816 [Salmonella enterica subsp. enterica serovar Cerro]|nr:hypothetical protein [Salmonella enterica subsp. enterica serovar Cerro]EEL1340359.1 hypothetical protein [Salmonella enterica subsp. enterica serovar Cerro]EEP2204173.1 hypothetical protein [Salmonella enterica subsp. enterica serovar Cerro]EFQ2222842.1 hypothetical protein [Salmonella enterica subsp. enterica serovar Cerro]EFZ9338498.1 hypothetical protein [Salmonella enterica subsp. enterica serovar Cerro]
MFPAPAGINRQIAVFSESGVCVPRASGDKPKPNDLPKCPTCVFPAPAGINRLAKVALNANSRVPRASGDKPDIARWDARQLECSPRQRG